MVADVSLLGSPVPNVFNSPVQLAMDDDVVLVGGFGSTQAFGTERYPKASREWVVRAYDKETGKLRWSDVSQDAPGTPDPTDEANGGVILANGLAVALGFVNGTDGRPHTLVRALDAKTGKLQWQDMIDRVGYPFGVTITLAAAEGRVTAASWVQGTRPAGTPIPEAFGINLLVRTYDVTRDGPDDKAGDDGKDNQRED